jgi:G3E family GTPase
MPLAPIPVTVIGGYLGAGKTTLVNRLLAGASGERLAVLVNDFGSVSIDASLIEGRDDDTIRLANGCVCCSLAGGFVEAMQRIGSLVPRPDRLVVETSGVADPAAVAQYAHLPGFELDGVVVVADAETVRRRADDALVGGHVRRQLAGADVIVLNKVDLVSPAELGGVQTWARPLAPAAAIVTALEAAVPMSVLLGRPPSPPSAVERTGDGSHVAHSTVTVTGSAPVAGVVLDAALAELNDDVLRVKGFVDRLVDDGAARGVERVLVQRVGTRTHISAHAGEPRTPAVLLVLIGLSDPAVRAAGRTLAAALGAAVASAEASHDAHHEEHE